MGSSRINWDSYAVLKGSRRPSSDGPVRFSRFASAIATLMAWWGVAIEDARLFSSGL